MNGGHVRSAVTRARRTVELVSVERPSPGPGEALVRVEHVTLCGTDLHIWEDDYASELPIVQGHEFAGTLAGLGAPLAATGSPTIAIGASVAVSPMLYCGHCHACSVGRVNACAEMSVYGCYRDGALTDLVVVPVANLHLVPEGLAPHLAALAEPLSIAMQAVRRGRALAGEQVLVLGCGPIGLFATMYLTELGSQVIAVDLDPARLALAKGFGASAALLVSRDEAFLDSAAAAALSRLTAGQGPVLVIEATGSPASLEAAVDVVAAAGRVVQVGISGQAATLPMRAIAVKEVDLLGSRNSLNLIGEALEVLTRHPDVAASLVTHRYPLERVGEAFEAMCDPAQAVGKVLIDVGSSSWA
jgi:L-gulonate 5-dehydrogenase